MNKQKAPGGIEWTRRRLPDGRELPGYTVNFIKGCLHDCKWVMPDGKVAQCYAKTVAEGLAREAYPNGFAYHYTNERALDEVLKLRTSAGIFIDSMSDLMGSWVPAAEIQRVLDVCAQASWHTFFLLTKHPARLSQFKFTPNVWIGVSSPPDMFRGMRLKPDAQVRFLTHALTILSRFRENVTWMSFEPLSWDVADHVALYPKALDWAVIGAASNGREHYPPDETHLKRLLRVLDSRRVPVFYKGNLRSLEWARENWRADFPLMEKTT